MNLLPAILAQANPGPDELQISSGQIISGLVVLAVMAASLVVLVIWGLRLASGTSPIPDARRAPLAAPPAVTVLGLVIAGLLGLMVMTSQLLGDPGDAAGPDVLTNTPATEVIPEQTDGEDSLPEESESDVAATPSEEDPSESEVRSAVADPESDSSDAEEEDADESQPAPNERDPDQDEASQPAEPGRSMEQQVAGMWNNLLGLFLIDVFLFVLLGACVMAAQSPGGRRLVPGSIWTPSLSTSSAGRVPQRRRAVSADGYSGPWGDLGAEATAEGPDEVADRSAALQADEVPAQGVADSDWLDEPSSYSRDAQYVSFDSEEPDSADALPGEPPEPWNFGSELRFAAEAVLACYLPTSILRIVLAGVLDDTSTHPLLQMLKDGVGFSLFLMITFLAVIVAPLVEELIYRVVLVGGGRRLMGTLPAVIVSSVLFGLAHGFPDCISLLPLASVLAYAYLKRRSYRTVMLMHFLFNAFNMGLALLLLS